jgi:hypothetical protein
MAGMKSVELDVHGTKDLALVSSADDSVWLVVPVRWWDLATLIWWTFCPADRKARVRLTMADGSKVGFRAVRVASRHVRIRGFDSPKT